MQTADTHLLDLPGPGNGHLAATAGPGQIQEGHGREDAGAEVEDEVPWHAKQEGEGTLVAHGQLGESTVVETKEVDYV